MTVLDEPAVSVSLDVDLEPEVRVVEDAPSPKGLLARLVPALVVFALLGLIGGAGTFAAFSASTDNAATFATGSLVLRNTITGQAIPCESDDDNGVDVNFSACEQLFAVSARKPGDVANQVVTLQNVGSVDASAVTLETDGSCLDDALPSGFTGTGTPADLCDLMNVVVEEVDGGGTPIACAYPAGASCPAFPTVGSPNPTFPKLSDLVDDHGVFGDRLPLGGGIVASDDLTPVERHFRVAVQLDPTAGNSVQGREASFSLIWRIEQ